MKFEEINPFIRYACRIQLTPRNIPVRAYDCRIFFIMSGELSIQINGSTVDALPNTLIFIKEGVEYRIITEKAIDMSVLNFDMSQGGSYRKEESPPIESYKFREQYIFSKTEIDDTDIFNDYVVIKNCFSLHDNITEIINKFSSNHMFGNMQSSAMLKLLLAAIAELVQNKNSEQRNIIECVLKYIKDNFSKDITNTDIGSFSGYHPNYINKLILDRTGITLKQHIINTRIEAAKSMLQYGNSTVNDIAYQCGFSDAAYFSYRFRKATGLSPQKYRQKYFPVI